MTAGPLLTGKIVNRPSGLLEEMVDKLGALDPFENEVSDDELLFDSDELEFPTLFLCPLQVLSKEEEASFPLSLGLFGQVLLRQSSISWYFLEQIQDKSFIPLHSDCFTTLLTQANKQAGGVATTLVAKAALITKDRNFIVISMS